ncbi:MAG: ester cyclase [Polyangiaceae bacterium]
MAATPRRNREPTRARDVRDAWRSSMTRDEIRNLVDAWAHAVESCDAEALERLTTLPLREGVVARARGVHGAFEGVKVTPVTVVIEGHEVAWRWRLTGRHIAAIAGIEPSGEAASVEGVNFQRVEGGRVVEHWTTVDLASLARRRT